MHTLDYLPSQIANHPQQDPSRRMTKFLNNFEDPIHSYPMSSRYHRHPPKKKTKLQNNHWLNIMLTCLR